MTDADLAFINKSIAHLAVAVSALTCAVLTDARRFSAAYGDADLDTMQDNVDQIAYSLDGPDPDPVLGLQAQADRLRSLLTRPPSTPDTDDVRVALVRALGYRVVGAQVYTPTMDDGACRCACRVHVDDGAGNCAG